MQIEIVTIGGELLLGFTDDTNSTCIAQELAAIGVEVVWRTSVGDDVARISEAVTAALTRTGAVITTGGLGPTSDDVTRNAIAEVFDRKLELQAEMLENLRQRWKARGLPGELPELNRSQAEIPAGAEILTNRHGTAPGLLLKNDKKQWVAMLPGVPREMRAILRDELIPRLKKMSAGGESVLRSFTIRTTGLPESLLAEKIALSARDLSEIRLAFLPGLDGVDLRLTVSAGSTEEADKKLKTAAMKLRAPVERYVYGEGDTDFAATVVEECRRRGLRIAVAESCTGGLLGARLTEVPGSSEVFVGGVIAYANNVKTAELGVSNATLEAAGAVSEPAAVAMAKGAKRKFRADIAVAITGIAGPGGGTHGKPVGRVWIAVEGRATSVRPFLFGGDRAEIRYRATQAALSMIREQIETD